MKNIRKMFLFFAICISAVLVSPYTVLATEYSATYYRCLVDSKGNYVKSTDTINANTTYKIVNIDDVNQIEGKYCIGTKGTIKYACDTSELGNAVASQVLKGVTFSSSSGKNLTGTLTDYGYEPTAGRIGEWQGGLYLYVPDIASGEQNRGVVQRSIRTDLSNLGNASASQVLSGATFTSSNGLRGEGTMANNGAWSTTVNAGSSVTIPAGYHNGSGKVTASSGLYGSPSMKTATNGNQQSASITATTSFSGKVVTVSGFGYSNNHGNSITLQILVNGSWITCSSANGTMTTTKTTNDRSLVSSVWVNSGIYKNSAISGARVIANNDYSDGWGGAHCIAVVV